MRAFRKLVCLPCFCNPICSDTTRNYYDFERKIQELGINYDRVQQKKSIAKSAFRVVNSASHSEGKKANWAKSSQQTIVQPHLGALSMFLFEITKMQHTTYFNSLMISSSSSLFLCNSLFLFLSSSNFCLSSEHSMSDLRKTKRFYHKQIEIKCY